jgi:transcription antitermination factor NusB
MTVPIRRRTRAREIAMQVLFQLDVRGDAYASEVGKTVTQLCADAAEDATDVVEFAARLVEGTRQQLSAIDQRLAGVTRNWDLRRMAIVDRNVLRMATWELLFSSDIPPKVVINEAIELGKKFSTANSGGFVNGILDRIRIDIEKERSQPAQAHSAQAHSAPAPNQTAGSQGSEATG